MGRVLAGLFVLLALLVGGWWALRTSRRAADLAPVGDEVVARGASDEPGLAAPDPMPVHEGAAESTASAPPERVEVELESRAAPAILQVRIFDAQGELWLEPTRIPSDAGIGVSGNLSDWERSVHEWPERVVVLAYERDALEGLGQAVGAPLKRAPTRDGDFQFEVVEGARYLVGALGAGLDGSLREVEVPRGSRRVVVDLHAEEPGALALLSVLVVTEHWSAFGVELQSLQGNVLLSMDSDVSQASFPFRVPAGGYRLVVEGHALTNHWHGYVLQGRALGRSEQEIELAAGQDEKVVLEIGAGAKLQIALSGDPNEGDERAARENRPMYAWMEPDEHQAEIRRRGALAELYLISDGRRREPVLLLQHAMEGTSAAGMHALNQWPLGATSASECLPAGRHTLIARLPGGREARAEVELREGGTTPVRLRF